MITNKSTKAEILTAYNELQELYRIEQSKAEEVVVTWPAVKNSSQIILDELIDFIHDVRSFGGWCRQGFEAILDNARLIVKK